MTTIIKFLLLVYNYYSMNTISHLNLTGLDLQQRDAVILLRCTYLPPGHSLVIYNDDDPMHSDQKFLMESGNQFSYIYLQKGPEKWTVQVSRIGNEQSPSLGQLAARDLRKAKIFKKYGLDVCCAGKKSLIEACQEMNISLEKVEIELNATTSPPAVNLNYNDWELGFLMDFIINSHHQYVKKSLKPLTELANKVANSHGHKNGNLIIIANSFKEIADEMDIHMMKQEQMVFPYIRSLLRQQKHVDFSTIQAPGNMLEVAQEAVEGKMAMISSLSNRYQLPPGGCASYSLLFQWLKEFQEDLQLHVHLENNILFPKAIKLLPSDTAKMI